MSWLSGEKAVLAGGGSAPPGPFKGAKAKSRSSASSSSVHTGLARPHQLESQVLEINVRGLIPYTRLKGEFTYILTLPVSAVSLVTSKSLL